METELEKMRLRMAEMAAEIERQQSANEQCGKALKGEIILCDSLRAENARLQSIIDEANAQEPFDFYEVAQEIESRNLDLPTYFGEACCIGSDEIYALLSKLNLYANPIPARQSQEVAVPCEYSQLAEKLIIEACSNAVEKLTELAPSHGWDSGEVVAEMYIRKLRAFNFDDKDPSPRITEQDAREIVSILLIDYRDEYCGQSIDSWIESCEELLLNKLNAKQE